MPGVARMQGCPEPCAPEGLTQEGAVALLRRAHEAGQVAADPDGMALMGWGLMHGLTSLYLSGHLAGQVEGREEFLDLIDGAIGALRTCFEAG
jgi:hypothetical protein